MPTLIMQKNLPQPHFWIWVILTFLIGIIITILREKKSVIYAMKKEFNNQINNESSVVRKSYEGEVAKL